MFPFYHPQTNLLDCRRKKEKFIHFSFHKLKNDSFDHCFTNFLIIGENFKNFVHTPFWLCKIIVCFHIWPVPLCYQSMHSNLKEKRQILKDTVNHIQTIHKEKGTEERKIERAYLQKDLNFYIWKNTYYAI